MTNTVFKNDAAASSMFPLIEPHLFSVVTKRMRLFFEQKGFLEVHTQNRLSIMAACEDPNTIATYDYAGKVWPLPQTGQMWLEYELLNDPTAAGFYCVSTSYRMEPNPTEGRHNLIFPMFEFELPGGYDALEQMVAELLEFLGFGPASAYAGNDYLNIANSYGIKELGHDEEERLYKDFGPIFFLKNFPEYTSPFWNMKRSETQANIANKLDVIMHGVETVGSAERSCNPTEMKEAFLTIEDGKYAAKIYSLFGKERVNQELDEFLSHNFFPRSGGGIGLTRMIRAMQLSNLI